MKKFFAITYSAMSAGTMAFLPELSGGYKPLMYSYVGITFVLAVMYAGIVIKEHKVYIE